jgi:NAD(P)-dependent dehydrogenase (short-subunit alcohol dehydrogenase family)
MSKPLAGQVALVTGAGGGIGREHALALAAAGATVVVNDLGVDLDGSGGSSAPAEAVVAEIEAAGGQAVSDAHSVADFGQAGAIVAAAVDRFGRLDLLVNNASVFRDGPFLAMTPEDFATDLSVHVFGTFNLSKHALPVMIEQGRGRIVSTTSNAWYSGVGYCAYAAAKGAISSFTYALAAECAHLGVTVNAIAPGAMTEHRAVQGERWREKVAAAGIPAPVMPPAPTALSADYVPPMVVYLASDAAAGITGQIFEVIGTTVGIYDRPDVVRRVSTDPASGPWTYDGLVAAVPQLDVPRLVPPAN